jgi:hypothetical protein
MNELEQIWHTKIQKMDRPKIVLKESSPEKAAQLYLNYSCEHNLLITNEELEKMWENYNPTPSDN